MVRKPSLSPTKIATYLACSSKYRWTYVDDRGKWFLRAKREYSFGSTLHAVLQRFHDSGDSGAKTVEGALATYDESWIDAGFSSAEEMAEAYCEGQEILERYVERHIERPAAATTLFVEKTLTKDMGEFRLAGRVDRIDEYEDGSLEIVDYKSGRSSVAPEDVKFDVAMGCYTLMLRELFPDRPIRATIVALRTGEQASASWWDEEIEGFASDIRVLGEEILRTDYGELIPVYKELCERCDFLPLCRKHPEFAYPNCP